TYTVRLTFDGASREQPVTVTVDPTVQVREDALEAQFDSASALSDAYSALNLAARGVDAVAQQLAAREATAAQLADGEPPEALSELFEEAGGKVDELLESIVGDEELGGWAQGPKIADQIFFLLKNIDSAFAAPSAAQHELQTELLGEAAAKLDEVNEYFEVGVEELNGRFEGFGVAPLQAPARVVLE
ncbi:MAG: hypothetical protein P8Y93_14920, partial [Acidobacteriota bacterium]